MAKYGQMSLFLAALAAGASGLARPVIGQEPTATSSPADEPVETKFLRTHEEFLAAAREHPPIGGIYRSPETGKDLSADQMKQVRKIESLLEDASSACEKGDVETAKKMADEAMTTARKLLGPTHFLSISATGARRLYGRYAEVTAEQLATLAQGDAARREAWAAYKASDFGKAEQKAKLAVELREKVVGSQYDELIDSDALRIQAMAQTEGGRAEQAEKTFVRLMDVLERSFGKNHPKTADALTRRGWLRITEGRMQDAMNDLRRALSIHEITDGETLDAARAMDHLGTALAFNNDPEGAIGRKIRAMMIRETLAGAESPDTAESYSNLAWLYHRIGMTAPVTPLRLKALAVFEKHLGLEHTYTFTEISNLARTHEELGEYNEAIRLYEKYLGKGGDRTLLDKFRLGARLGAAYLRVGRRDDAKKMFDTVLAEIARADDDSARRIALSNTVTSIRAYMQNHLADEAVALLTDAAKAVAKSTGKPATDRDVLPPADLGTLYEMVGRNKESVEMFREATKLARQSQRDDKDNAVIMLLFAQVNPLIQMKDHREAEAVCDEALRMTDREGYQGSPLNALALLLMGRTQAANGQNDRAQFYLEDAGKLFKANKDQESIPYIHYLTEWGRVLGALGDKSGGRAALAEAVQKSRDLMNKQSLPEYEFLLLRALRGLADVAGDADAIEELKTRLQKRQQTHSLIGELRDWPKELGL
ncbi:MAG: hypothetical protein HBSAPP02_26310 [Phycisphaerae bacterium]|nr:MAG: hypothetical protein DCC66_10780 [Planctomycetota bacterium]GJQ27599.1 MAG: hypothetical protein HBSAPP02_26310 [Phycisphaerae bacterium]